MKKQSIIKLALITGLVFLEPLLFLSKVNALGVVSTELISKNLGTGLVGNDIAEVVHVSSDGRYVAFYSEATNLISGDTNGQSDVFLRDMTSNTMERVSISSGGAQGNSYSFAPSISNNGLYVAFCSNASNLVAGDTNAQRDIFFRDIEAGTTTRISVSTAGVQANNRSANSSVSTNGRYIAFESEASNLVTGDTNGVQDIFIRDMTENTTTRVSISTAGDQANAAASGPSISDNGRFIAFFSTATNLVTGDTNGKYDAFVRDTVANTTERISISTEEVQGDGDSFVSSFSSDGRYLTFTSYATNLVSGDTNAKGDVFVRDRTEGTTTRISISTTGEQGNNNSGAGGDYGGRGISANGRYVVFESNATNLVIGDTNALNDMFIRDTLSDTTTRVNTSPAGEQANDDSWWPNISSDGRFVVFNSSATNLAPEDLNDNYQVFLVTLDIDAPEITSGEAAVSGNQITIHFDQNIAEDPVVNPNDFTVLVNGVPVTISALVVNGSDIILTLSQNIKYSDVIIITYSSETGISDEYGNATYELSLNLQMENNPNPDILPQTGNNIRMLLFTCLITIIIILGKKISSKRYLLSR